MANVTHATKPAAKKAAAPKAKAAAKPAVKKATRAKAPKGVKVQVVNRPGSGVLLFAYTEAALQLLGMYKGAEVEKHMLMRVMGLTAIAYHTTQKSNMVRLDNGKYILTDAGKAFFTERKGKAAEADIQGWMTVLSTGVADGVVVKNQAMLVAI